MSELCIHCRCFKCRCDVNDDGTRTALNIMDENNILADEVSRLQAKVAEIERFTKNQDESIDGFKVGDYIAGDEGYGVTVLRIDYIGKRHLICTKVEHDGKQMNQENTWTLSHREWKKVEWKKEAGDE